MVLVVNVVVRMSYDKTDEQAANSFLMPASTVADGSLHLHTDQN